MEKEKSTENSKQPSGLMRFSGFGFQMVVTLCLAAWGGLKLDEKFGTNPLFLVVLLLAALGGSMYIFIRQVSKSN